MLISISDFHHCISSLTLSTSFVKIPGKYLGSEKVNKFSRNLARLEPAFIEDAKHNFRLWGIRIVLVTGVLAADGETG